MQKAVVILLSTLVFLLSVLIYLEYIRPELSIRKNQSNYLSVFNKCASAEESLIKILDEPLFLNRENGDSLLKTIEVEKLICLERDILKAAMIGKGVSVARIQHLESLVPLNRYIER